MSLQAKAYLFLVGSVGFALALFFLFGLDFSQFLIPLILLTIASFVTEIYELEIATHWFLSTSIAVKLAAIYVGGAPLGVWVVMLSTLPAEMVLRWDDRRTSTSTFLSKVIFNTGQLTISLVLAAFVFQLSGGHPPPYQTFQDYLSLVWAFIVYEATSASFVSVIVSMVTAKRFSYILLFSLRNLHLQFMTMGVIAILMSILYSTSPWNLALAFLLLALVHYSTRGYLRLRRTSHAAFTRITELLSQRDLYTGVHSKDVEEWALSLAQALELSDEQIEAIKMGAAIHDIGKIAVPDAILHKLGKLTDEEWVIMKRHPVVGADIIKDLEIYRDVVPIVRHEHEHWDGSGYPNGLQGEGIPIGARIIAVADVYSALTTERKYRPPQGKPLKYTQEQACEILKDMAGKVLDPHLVDAFINKVLKKVEVQ